METRPRRHWSPVLVPLAVAALFALAGHPLRGATVALVALVVAGLIFAGVPVSSWVERGAARLGRGLTTAGGVFVFLLVIGPAWTWGRITRRDAFARSTTEPGWSLRSPAPETPRSTGSATPVMVGQRSIAGRLTWSVGCVVLLLAANYGLGWGWDQVTDDRATLASTDDDTSDTSAGAPIPRSETRYDPRVESAALAGSPWRSDYLADLQRTPVAYWPYTQYRPEPFASPYINIDGWTRRSYRTPGPATDRPEVWMFGGSTTWGEGQRDGYTIASWLARLAEDQGIPLEIGNFGERGWTHFQDMVLFEQQLALEGAPDAAVFYDGVNEINTQSLVAEAVPSHYDIAEAADAVDGKSIATRFGANPSVGSLTEDLWYAYSEHSLIHKVAGAFDTPAGASASEAASTDAQASTGRTAQSTPDDDQVTPDSFEAVVQDGTDAGQVYERGKELTLSLSERHDVATLLYWQPFKVIGPVEQAATDEITPPTIDISELLLDRQDVFIDGAHTNEEGARLVAVRIWEDLEPQIRRWYEEHP